jgi:uncharacterized membrane protein
MMARALVVGALLWPAAASAAVAVEVRSGPVAWTEVVRLVGARICHQRPERSFHAAGVQWPVCARCSGLYLGAAAGAWLGLLVRFAAGRNRARAVLAVAGVITVVTWLAEWVFGAPVTNGVRFAAAVPLGAAIAAIIVRTAAGRSEGGQVN